MAEENFRSGIARALEDFAMAFPETSNSPSCVNRSFRARKKGFMFLGEKDTGVLRLMVKLDAGIESANAVAEANPDGWSVKGPGWITGNFTDDEAPPLDVMMEWIDESYRLLAPKTLVGELNARQD